VNERRKFITLAAATGILAGLAACAGPKAASTANAVVAPSAEDKGDRHGCGQHEAGACGAHDDHAD
jgi:hypothetical protein